MAWVTMPALVGPIIGPPVGGFITTYASWHWIFLINVPIGLIGIVLALRYIEDVRVEGLERFDIVGVALAGAGVAGLAFGLSVVGLGLLPPAVVAGLVAGGAIFMGAYVVHARQTPAPVLDFSLVRIPTLRATVIGGSLFRLGIGSLSFLLPLMLQLGFDYTPLESGLLTFTAAVGAFTMKSVAAPHHPPLRLPPRADRQRADQLGLHGGLRGLHAGHAVRRDGCGAADRRLLPLAAVHRHQHDRLCGRRSAAHEPRDLAGQRAQQLSIAAGVAVGALAVELAVQAKGEPASSRRRISARPSC